MLCMYNVYVCVCSIKISFFKIVRWNWLHTSHIICADSTEKYTWIFVQFFFSLHISQTKTIIRHSYITFIWICSAEIDMVDWACYILSLIMRCIGGKKKERIFTNHSNSIADVRRGYMQISSCLAVSRKQFKWIIVLVVNDTSTHLHYLYLDFFEQLLYFEHRKYRAIHSYEPNRFLSTLFASIYR